MINTLLTRINIIKPTEKELILRINPVLAHLVALAFIGLALLSFLCFMTIPNTTTNSSDIF